MRQVNQKIYQVAEMEGDDEVVRIGQLITDNLLEEKFNETDTEISREEANKVIQEGRQAIYGREGPTQPIAAGKTNTKIKEAFATSAGDKTKTGIQKPAAATKKPAAQAAPGKTSPGTKVNMKAPAKPGQKVAPAAAKKAKPKPSNAPKLILLLIIVAAAAYYFMTATGE